MAIATKLKNQFGESEVWNSKTFRVFQQRVYSETSLGTQIHVLTSSN